MQAKTDTPAAETASLLESFGIELSAGGLVVMTDFAKAESAYVHHSSVPVAVVAMAVASPTFARGRFPKLRLVDVVTKVAAMDGREMRALATVCGANIDSLPEGSMGWPDRSEWTSRSVYGQLWSGGQGGLAHGDGVVRRTSRGDFRAIYCGANERRHP
jgi:hypothetical protein